MTKGVGADHEYELLSQAKAELVSAIANPPADPEQWSTEFNSRFRALITTPDWMRTGLVLPGGASKNENPTLGSLINEAREGMGLPVIE